MRSRADARGDLMTARHRLSKMLLRRGIVYDGARTWTRIHDAWLRRVRRDHVIGMGPSALAAFDDAYDTVVHATARRDRLDEAIAGLPRRRRAPPPPPGVWPAFVVSAP